MSTRRATRSTRGRGRSSTPKGRRSNDDAGVDNTPVTPGSLSSLTVVTLRGILSARGVSYSGLRKAQLIQACIESSSPTARKTASKRAGKAKASPSPSPARSRSRTPSRSRKAPATPKSTRASRSQTPKRTPRARTPSRSRRTSNATTPGKSPTGAAVSRLYSHGENTNAVSEAQAELHHVREQMNLLHHPLLVLQTFVIVMWQHLLSGIALLFRNRALLALLTFVSVAVISLYHTPGDHHTYLDLVEDGLTWVGLGVLSSVGLGTGLHTFVLNLGPHIFMVAFTAYECKSLDFEVVGENSFICPEAAAAAVGVSFWGIVRKVQWEALLWGAGTAIGELPPYFVARAARLSGKKLEELEEEEEIDDSSFVGRLKRTILEHTEHLNFFTIMLLASVPNPLFDLAGLTCGHLLVPFWTFFGATLIGKALNKAHLQVFFVIMLANDVVMKQVIALCSHVPRLGQFVQGTVEAQHRLLHRHPGTPIDLAGKSMLSYVWDGILFVCIGSFVLSIISGLVRGELVARAEARLEEAKAKADRNRRARAGRA